VYPYELLYNKEHVPPPLDEVFYTVESEKKIYRLASGFSKDFETLGYPMYFFTKILDFFLVFANS
jgi:hypothetical protein